MGLTFTPEAINLIAELSEKMNSGARGLRGVIERCLRDIMFDAPSMRRKSARNRVVTVTADTVRENLHC